MIQITPQMKILVALEPADFRKGIDGLARVCKESLQRDPFEGTVFVFRNRRGTAIKILCYDGQGFWLCQKRMSEGRFRWWPSSTDKPSPPSKPLTKGHGRNGADAYSGAEQTEVPHESLQAGDPCPKCEDGSRLYQMTESGTFVEIVGQAPLGGTVYTLQKLRCNLCGKIFTAELPEGIGPKKYDATSAAMIGMMKYGTGMPFNRMDGLQGNLGIPMPASTQWDLAYDMYVKIDPVFHTLVWYAGQGELLHNDDTTVRILELMGKRAKQTILAGMSLDEESIGEHRTGMYTTGIVSMNEGHRIALFFSSRQHAGENLKDVLDQRAKDLEPPIQMCDGLSRNLPGELKTILANCLAHYLEFGFIWSGLSNHDSSRVSLQRREKIAPDNGEPDAVLRCLRYYAKESTHKGSSRYPRASRHAAMAGKRIGRNVHRHLHYLDPTISCPHSYQGTR